MASIPPLRGLTAPRGLTSRLDDGSEPGGSELARDPSEEVCWKRTGSLVRMSVPSSLLPGVVTTATASVPDGRPSGLLDLGSA